MKKLLLVASIIFILSPAFSFAQTEEKILQFNSDIVVNKDASLIVTESIQINVTNNQINHGIYRDFPTSYYDASGKLKKVGFKLQKVYLDGVEEKYHLEKSSGNIRIYVGDEDVTVSPGVHIYTLVYKTEKQIRFFEEFDELYWNVTGNFWNFPIDSSAATVHLPGELEATDIMHTAYTGSFGSNEQNYEAYLATTSMMYFVTTESLNSREGFTIVVQFPKGTVTEPPPPTALENFFLKFSWIFLVLLIWVYYIWSWFKRGRDPRRGVVIPEYESPENFSPAQIGYLFNRAGGRKSLVAAIMSMATKGYLIIKKEKKDYELVTTGKGDDILSPEELAVAHVIFKNQNTFEIGKTNAAEVSGATDSLDLSLMNKFGKEYFQRNYLFILGGVLLSFGMVILSLYMYENTDFNIPMLLIIIFIFLPNIIFLPLMDRRTVLGRKVQDKIEGFKWFLTVTEKDRINFHNPPEKTPELFEKFLPFAFALGVETKWAKQFDNVFAKLEEQGQGYHPAWFVGNSFSSAHLSGFVGDVSSSFNSAVIGAIATHQAASGGGGGGFSGGGGGGGGGGGW